LKSVDISRCYGCGPDNPSGLHLKKTYSGDKARIEFTVEPEYAGYPGLMHGGVTCVLMDEVMYHAIARDDIVSVLAKMTVDYRNPALVGDHLVCEAWIDGHEGRKIHVTANIINSRTKALVAEGKGLFVEVDLDKLLNKNNDPKSD
jgi:acyl-coenzyme A thioesterase PaaI-like protein